MTKKKLISISILLIILLLTTAAFLFFREDEQSAVELVEKEKTNWEELDYSRVSFFNTSEHRASINIPEKWEGTYRLKENGSTANFYYLDKQGSELLMFSVKKIPLEQRSFQTACVSGDTGFDVVLADFEMPGEEDLVGAMKYIKNTLSCY